MYTYPFKDKPYTRPSHESDKQYPTLYGKDIGESFIIKKMPKVKMKIPYTVKNLRTWHIKISYELTIQLPLTSLPPLPLPFFVQLNLDKKSLVSASHFQNKDFLILIYM